MTISYLDIDKVITPERAKLLGKFNKVYSLPNGLIKKHEAYHDNKLFTINYYLDAGEREEDAKTILSTSGVSYGILEREIYHDYVILKDNSYVNNQQTKKWKHLHDKQDKLICIEELDINTNEPVFETTLKFLGEYVDERSTEYCKFYYRKNGDFWFCAYNYLDDYDSDEFEIERLPWIKERFRLTDAMYNYYLTADFLPPI